jgi:hypothetical protein
MQYIAPNLHPHALQRPSPAPRVAALQLQVIADKLLEAAAREKAAYTSPYGNPTYAVQLAKVEAKAARAEARAAAAAAKAARCAGCSSVILQHAATVGEILLQEVQSCSFGYLELSLLQRSAARVMLPTCVCAPCKYRPSGLNAMPASVLACREQAAAAEANACTGPAQSEPTPPAAPDSTATAAADANSSGAAATGAKTTKQGGSSEAAKPGQKGGRAAGSRASVAHGAQPAR